MSEGLDFTDHAGRAVVITGIPFATRTDPKVCEHNHCYCVNSFWSCSVIQVYPSFVLTKTYIQSLCILTFHLQQLMFLIYLFPDIIWFVVILLIQIYEATRGWCTSIFNSSENFDLRL